MSLVAELAVVFAAGAGSRMRSSLPKVMHLIGGMSMLGHVMKSASACARRVLLVVSAEIYEDCRKNFPHALLVVQEKRDGTGGAADCALAHVDQLADELADQLLGEGGEDSIIFLNADAPLITERSLRGLLGALQTEDAALALLGFYSSNPSGYGRLLGGKFLGGKFLGAGLHDEPSLFSTSVIKEVREEDDCSLEEKSHRKCNAGVYATRIERARLRSLISALPISRGVSKSVSERGDRKLAERRLTDLVSICNLRGDKVIAYWTSEDEAVGVNSAEQLSFAEGIWQRRMRAKMLQAGVFLRAPETVFFSHDTRIGVSAVVEPYVCFGNDVEIGTEAIIHSFCHIEGACISPKAVIGPFARLRATSNIGERAKIGNFVETKNVTLGADTRASHLSYIGDCTIAEKVNVGAGVITCNYDGSEKHHTYIGAAAFIGSNSSLIAPLSVGAGARIAASSAIDRDIPANTLAIERNALAIKPIRGKGRGKERGKDAKAVTKVSGNKKGETHYNRDDRQP